MDNKTIRIRTTPGVDKNIKVELNQDFDFIEILSLKLTQQDVYESFCADYGVVVGRVIANEGFGVPNAKVSIFIPISDEDQKNDLIRTLYPYKTVTSTNDVGIRYNLFLEKSTCSLNTPIGTFPTKETVLNNDIYLEIFDKYYKYTTVTNDAGDYIIFGVPTGQQTVHMDVDLSDIGFLSLRPYDLKAQGFPDSLFNNKNFKTSNNLDSLAQVKSQNKGVDVVPFWGDTEKCNFGITRVDFNIGNDIGANSIFMGSIFTDSNENALKESCNIKLDMGEETQLLTGPGQVDILKLNLDFENNPIGIEKLASKEIDENGVYIFTLPLYYDRVITDEFGNLIKSLDPTKGVPTKGKYRFKLKFNDDGQFINGKKVYKTGSLIIPSTYDSVRFTDNINSYINIDVMKDFQTFEWKQVYTTSQYIRKIKENNSDRYRFIGLKNCGDFLLTSQIALNNNENITLSEDDVVDEEQTISGGKNLHLPYTVFLKRRFGSFTKNKKLKACFYDSWLSGGSYLFKFRVKNKGDYAKCCAFNIEAGTMESPNGSNYYINGTEWPSTINTQIVNASINGTELPNGVKCTLLSPDSTRLPYLSGFNSAGDPTFADINNVLNGASDTNEYVYCKWTLDTKIINLGSMLMCQEVLDTLKSSLSNNVGSILKPFNRPNITNCAGTNIENGIRTVNLIPFLTPTTYLNPNDVFPYQNVDKNGQSNQFLSDWGNKKILFDSNSFLDSGYQEKELKKSYGGCHVPYYCRIDYEPILGNDGNPIATDCVTVDNLNISYLDSQTNSYFGCTYNLGKNSDYSRNYDNVYFYFGLIPGSTALDKLKKDFF